MIRARIRSVTLSVFITSIITIYILSSRGNLSSVSVLHHLGWYPIYFVETIKPLFLTTLLFTGPLFEKAVVDSGWRRWLGGRELRETLSSWIGWRNIVAGPVTEEILFRSLIVALHLLILPIPSAKMLILTTPLYFGIAHVHHFYEYTLTHPFTSTLPALLRSLVQFCYTTVFGWYATFLLLRTGSVWSVILVHSFCNWMGLPRLWGKVGGITTEVRVVCDAVRGKEDEDREDVQGGGLAIGWTLTYYVVLLSGIIAWWQGLWVLTESKGTLITF